jgi:hypothetical protein
MATRGGQIGNKNPATKRIWTAAIQRALAKRGKSMGDALDELAGKLLDLADEGELNALKELGDRLEGKAVQAEEIKVEGDVRITQIARKIIGA